MNNGRSGGKGAGGSEPEQTKVIGRPFPKGVSGNPGGQSKQMAAIQRMLDAEHRNVENVREGMNILRKLAFHGVTNDVYFMGAVCGQKTEYSAAFMDLYWNRVLGPVKKADLAEELVELMRAATDSELDVLIAIKKRIGT
jgi:hypothetical protein